MRKCGNFKKKQKRKFGSIRDEKDMEDKNVFRRISRRYLDSLCLYNCLCVCYLGNWVNFMIMFYFIYFFKNLDYVIDFKMFFNMQ